MNEEIKSPPKADQPMAGKILIGVFVVLIIASVGATYWRIMVKRDYVIEAQTDCDPYEDVCFVWECDPESDVEGEACTGDEEMDIWYFQVARRNAANIPDCDVETDENCDPWTCEENEADCEVEFCTQDSMEDQYAVSCNDPVVFTEENPMEEEECDPEVDEECVVNEEAAEEEEEVTEGEVAENEGAEEFGAEEVAEEVTSETESEVTPE